MATKTMKTMTDARGQEVPVTYVAAYDKAKDRVVRRIEANARKLKGQMRAFLADAVRAMTELSGLKENLGERGNFSARSFDAKIQVSIRQSWNIRLDERTAKARELMMDYACRELEKAGSGAYLLQQMIEAAFKVDRLGFMPRREVTKLLTYKVNDAKWNEGAAILRECQTTEKGKRYFVVETRQSTQDEFKILRLDIADCWPKDGGSEGEE